MTNICHTYTSTSRQQPATLSTLHQRESQASAERLAHEVTTQAVTHRDRHGMRQILILVGDDGSERYTDPDRARHDKEEAEVENMLSSHPACSSALF